MGATAASRRIRRVDASPESPASRSAREEAERRARALAERAARSPLGRYAPRLFKVWHTAGADLLAGGLTFASIFAFVPALLLTTGLISLVVADEAQRRALAAGIGDVFPPIRAVAISALDARIDGRINASIIAALGSVWGASTFYGALDEAFARVFREAPRRGMLVRIWRGMLSVVMLLALVAVMVLLTGVATRMTNVDFLGLGRAFGWIASVVAPLLALAVWIGAIYAAFRVIPTVEVTREAALRPAIVVGTFLAIWTQAMAILGTFFIGIARELGPGLGVLAVLMWLWVSFNAIILGASWVRLRLEDAETEEASA